MKQGERRGRTCSPTVAVEESREPVPPERLEVHAAGAVVIVRRRGEHWPAVRRELGDGQAERLAAAPRVQHRVARADETGDLFDVRGPLQVDHVGQRRSERRRVEEDEVDIAPTPRDGQDLRHSRRTGSAVRRGKVHGVGSALCAALVSTASTAKRMSKVSQPPCRPKTVAPAGMPSSERISGPCASRGRTMCGTTRTGSPRTHGEIFA